MAYYSSNVDAFLYVGASTATTLPAPGSDTFSEFPLLVSITPPAYEMQTRSFNVLNRTAPYAVGGKLNEQTVPGTMVIDRSLTAYQRIASDIKIAGGQRRNYRIVYPDDSQEDFVAFVSSFTKSAMDAGSDPVEHTAEFVLSIDGEITETL